MRVIAGSARGRRLSAPSGRSTRPTSDRVREALFSSLASDVPGAYVLDLFAGTGALGIEALSRGASGATFVERDAGVIPILRANLETTGVGDRAEVVRLDAAAFVQRSPRQPYDVVLCDPPYDHPLTDILGLVDRLAAENGLAPDAVTVVERDKRDPAVVALAKGQALDAPRLLEIDRQRSYGDTVLLYFRSPATERD